MRGAAHTPGPWQALYVGCEKSVLIGTADGEIAFARMERFDGTPSEETQDANATLIAAAPDLLAALRSVLHDIDRETMPVTVETIEAAIAKAEGRP